MFKTIKRIIDWCGEFKGKLYLGFVFSILSTWAIAAPIMIAAYTLGLLIDDVRGVSEFDEKWVWRSLILITLFILVRFVFDYLRAKYQETISYELVARDRLAVGDILKRVSLGYFQKVNIGEMLNSITTGLSVLESMGIRMIDTFIGGYLSCICLFLCLVVFNPYVAMITIAGVSISFIFLIRVSKHSVNNSPVSAAAYRDISSAAIEYARGLPIVKSFGQSGVSIASMKKASADSKNINIKIELGFTPSNCAHLISLKLASVGIVFASAYLTYIGQMELPIMIMFCMFSFTIFGKIELVTDSAHVLGIIDDAMDQLDYLKREKYIDEEGSNISINNYDIEFENVSFAYENNEIIKNVSFEINENTTTAIVGPSGSGKTTLCYLIARFYDVNKGTIRLGGHDLKEFTCDSLLSNISMVFQNVYLFNDTIRKNICFGKPNATEEEIIDAAKKSRCHEFIMALPNGYDTVVEEGGSSLSGGERQRISIARAILKNSPIVILDEATASVDPENEHLIQDAISELTKNKTIITIAHRLSTIENADQILVVDEGKIVEKGTHKELLRNNGVYKRFVSIRETAEGWSI
ncbi:MAG: ABC transporter ATP-binding protein/permease [Vallitalea sp.]|jgi:ATP-binding cassette subfamily B protein|nr:ABC transporter ATP-binding protein/permease [Vallitalea sp.]MCT4597701.1 ABC transporter ATP-binding protein/permease [Vallitalea sp.]